MENITCKCFLTYFLQIQLVFKLVPIWQTESATFTILFSQHISFSTQIPLCCTSLHLRHHFCFLVSHFFLHPAFICKAGFIISFARHLPNGYTAHIIRMLISLLSWPLLVHWCPTTPARCLGHSHTSTNSSTKTASSYHREGLSCLL